MNIYWGYPSFCLFYTKAKCAESEVMVPSVEAYLRAAEAPRRGREGKAGAVGLSGKGMLWFLSPGSCPSPPRSTGANHCLPLSATGNTQKSGRLKKKITSLIFMDMYHFIFMTSANHIVIRFKHGLNMHTHQDGH